MRKLRRTIITELVESDEEELNSDDEILSNEDEFEPKYFYIAESEEKATLEKLKQYIAKFIKDKLNF